MEYSIARMTLFSLLSSIEQDMRSIICDELFNSESMKEIFGDALYAKTIERQKKDKDNLNSCNSDDDLVMYLDYEDHIHVLNANKGKISESMAQYIKLMQSEILSLTKIRNRVFHSRPLHLDDLSKVQEVCDKLIVSKQELWDTTYNTIRRLRSDPSFVIGLRIPTYYESDIITPHNLPLPDFDETGFIGRDKLLQNIKGFLEGPFPVISIVGEGGLGKTAIALKVAYDLLETEKPQFDAIIWVSSKTYQLTPTEIRIIDGAITNSLKLFKVIESQLSGVESADPLEEISQYMSMFKLLIIIDNLETVLDDRITEFVSQIKEGSKILITSRIGLGAFEVPVKLAPMTNDESVFLLRTLIKCREINILQKINSETLSGYCQKMNNNPGHIKWFISTIQTGKRPEEVLQNPDIFLDYCMSNVYSFIDDASKSVLRAMLCINNELSQAELMYVSEMETVKLQKSIQQLLRTNMVCMRSNPVGSSSETKYEIAELARRYLQNKFPMRSEEYKKYSEAYAKLVREKERYKPYDTGNEYSINKINVRSNSDFVIAKKLQDAIEATRRKRYDDADQIIEDVKRLAPEYYEVRRIEAWVRTNQGNFSAANDSYQAAVDLNPNNSALRLWFGLFLMNHVNDTKNATIQFKEAYRINKILLM